jgi:hypothetical protein
LAIAAAFAVSANSFAGPGGVTLQGNPYTPAGANFSIYAAQGIDASHPTGTSGYATQVNTNFEFTPSIGVSYDTGGGKLTDFGIGLYAGSSKQAESTGLNVKFNSLTNASSASVTVMDFDIQSAAAGFKTQKVEPGILIFGANGSVIANAMPTDVLHSMVQTGSNTDIWNINFGTLLNKMGVGNATMSGFELYADATHGEKVGSDPYLMVSAAAPAPEPASLAALGLGLTALIRRRLSK